MKKILVIQTAFLGDVVLATAVLEKLHQHDPQSRIDYLVRKGNETLLAAHPFIHTLYVWNKQQAKYKNWLEILQKIRKEKYEVVINLQRFFSTGLLTALSGADKTIGFKNNPFGSFFSETYPHHTNKGLHEIERNQSLIATITDAMPALPRLYPSTAQWNKVKAYKSTPYFCIAPTSVWFTKQYHMAGWIDLLDHLPTQQPVYLLGAKADQVLCEHIKAATKHQATEILCGKLDLLESAALMADAQLNYVNDSAPLHLASAVNAPVCAVFCSTIPAFGFTPLSAYSFVVQTPKDLPCRPCGLHGYKQCPKGHFECTTSIATEQLIAVVSQK